MKTSILIVILILLMIGISILYSQYIKPDYGIGIPVMYLLSIVFLTLVFVIFLKNK